MILLRFFSSRCVIVLCMFWLEMVSFVIALLFNVMLLHWQFFRTRGMLNHYKCGREENKNKRRHIKGQNMYRSTEHNRIAQRTTKHGLLHIAFWGVHTPNPKRTFPQFLKRVVTFPPGFIVYASIDATTANF